eukprot:m.355541 g.355541  ORF g.355541 m.355541 type:complete len:198 (-) comp17275_c0_seq1:401-994(-)
MSGREEVRVEVATAQDVVQVAGVHSTAFIDKTCFVCNTPSSAHEEAQQMYATYSRRHKTKLSHCGLVRGKDGAVAGALQLTLPGDVGDLSFPSFMRHVNKPHEAYIDWVGVNPDYRGKGIGSALLAWADETARAAGCQTITLDVVTRNEAARRLYERKGYVVQEGAHGCFASTLVCCMFVCCTAPRYTGAHEMTKQL